MPQLCHFSVLALRLSNMARMPEIEELKRATELRSTLRAVSKPGAGALSAEELGGSGSAWLPAEPRPEHPTGLCLFAL